MPMKKAIGGLAVLAATVIATAASAHDFFLLPASFTADRSGTVIVQATVGSTFPNAEAAVPADRADRLFAFGPGSPRIRIAGAQDKALNLQVSGAKRGLLVAAASSKPRDVDYAEDRIPLILEEYRLLPEAAAAVEALPRPRNWQVVSRRFAKTFLCVVDCRNRAAADRAAGAPLEFVGDRGSADLFRLIAHGKPLAGYPVDLVGEDGKRRHLATDARGQVRLPADGRGKMMLFAAKLEPPADGERFTLDLTSLTLSRN
jgi:hypothetical protein